MKIVNDGMDRSPTTALSRETCEDDGIVDDNEFNQNQQSENVKRSSLIFEG